MMHINILSKECEVLLKQQVKRHTHWSTTKLGWESFSTVPKETPGRCTTLLSQGLGQEEHTYLKTSLRFCGLGRFSRRNGDRQISRRRDGRQAKRKRRVAGIAGSVSIHLSGGV